jgi:serine protease Do
MQHAMGMIVRRPPLSLGLLVLVVAIAASIFHIRGAPPSGSATASPSDQAIAAPPPSSGPSDAIPPNGALVAVAKKARSSVVNISLLRRSRHEGEPFSSPFFDDPLFRRFFGEEFERRFKNPPREHREQGLGSGVIVSSGDYIVTNNHVVEQADEVNVLLADKRSFKATVIGTDPKTDVAILKIEAAGLPALPWGDSTRLEVGELVLAVGNPFGLGQTVTMGIISAVGRANMGIVDYEDFIQTDAAINPGNSGGALVNLNGELIGINTAIFSRSGGNMGIGFAIPSNMAKSVMQSLLKHGKVIRGWLGVSIQEVTPDLAKEFGAPDTKGALVAEVMDDGPASRAKLERGDIITAFNGIGINDPAQLRSLVADTPPDTTVMLTVWRDKDTRELKVTIAELPKELAKSGRGRPDQSRGEHALAGVTVEELPSERPGPGRRKAGVVVRDVEDGSPADRAGLRPGDIIREIDRQPIRSVQDFERIISQLSPRRPVLVLLSILTPRERDGEDHMFVRGRGFGLIHILRKPERPGERAVRKLLHMPGPAVVPAFIGPPTFVPPFAGSPLDK